MKVIGITGGIGAGKSMVLSYLSAKDKSETLEADKLAHQLMKKGQKTYKKIANEFGEDATFVNLHEFLTCQQSWKEFVNRIPSVRHESYQQCNMAC